MSNRREPSRRLLARGSWPEWQRVSGLLRAETFGGALLLAAAGAALVWANSPWSSGYHRLSEFVVGPQSLHLDLSLSAWAADGLLAIFFFVVGVELKREFVAGDLRDPARAALPIAAAVGGMVVPAAVFVGINLFSGHPETLGGWAVPIATDIAFALAVLAVVSTHLPAALRIFLLTLAVVDDLLAITVIAVFYTDHLALGPLAAALIPIGLFAVAVQRGVRQWWILLPPAALAWALVHASGVHATVAGVVLGFTVPVLGRHAAAEHFEHRMRPLSAGFAVPVFAFFAAGVTVGGWSGFADALSHPVTIGVIAGLVLGKPIGVLGTTYLLARFTHASLDEDLAWRDVLGVALLAGVGFTVSLLIGELAFGHGSVADDDVKIAVVTGSVVAGLLASVVLVSRNAAYRRIHQLETIDADHDGVPDVYQPRQD
ncbi:MULTISPECIES: Na+/H+ antiporter NhaA [unclassified Mycolicibacterium]|uniref:Na+/H+ antiporter NhaA n=1 Tax=unclassified Mycolicibacterium TaxID=2636767 RepID=UPI0012DDD549|nr:MULTISPECIES: Na+/H+ antiporter NhaA [unclassified Mycolicibacterium]MUL80255.1 Na+/H+ antiporter NhaA [Mycolicibacterium sp. CBMA 329]MUL86022.1 Na+/H+ antiporter NhaA [Mycolicibacterium sp. CBMA 331]MUM00796.1 Na+/H+ antiporter NhaA [Mycolicibacterium sp. CBMA 334]MUM28218.1 Na+/H+ antiporter NhaA [Mycolicibacterium sp. CBMA 295]MUM36318.1 Na+/H+ antiporter NhaA [Mycolicibacterium sp. CBMA 247]